MKKVISVFMVCMMFILSANAAPKTYIMENAATGPHCDYTITYTLSDGRTITASGHVEGMWCIDFLREFY